MTNGRLEAFSDGVIAIIITIMVLELKVPHGDDLAALRAAAAGVPELRAELRLPRHLLEQPPPHAARRRRGSTARSCGRTCTCCSGCRWCRSPPAGWARTTSPPLPDGGLRRRAAAGRRSPTTSCSNAIIADQGAGLDAGGGGRQRLEGQDLAAALPASAIAARLRRAAGSSIGIYVLVALIWLVPDRRIERRLRS